MTWVGTKVCSAWLAPPVARARSLVWTKSRWATPYLWPSPHLSPWQLPEAASYPCGRAVPPQHRLARPCSRPCWPRRECRVRESPLTANGDSGSRPWASRWKYSTSQWAATGKQTTRSVSTRPSSRVTPPRSTPKRPSGWLSNSAKRWRWRILNPSTSTHITRPPAPLPASLRNGTQRPGRLPTTASRSW